MNKEWSEFLQSRPVESQSSTLECALNDLSHFGLIQVEGEDAFQFLQGQLTNDMREVTEDHSSLSSCCTAKGRMIANFRVFRRGPAYLLQTPRANLESVIKRLRMYVLMSKVIIRDVSDDLARFGITGDCAVSLLQAHFPDIPSTANEAVELAESVLIKMPGSLPRFEVVGPSGDLIKLWQACESKTKPMDQDFWALQEIRAGIPTVFPETTEAFVPQMVNMQLIDGVSFTKGCYTGQEVVARMQYLGKLKRRMYFAHVESDTPPKPGDELFAEGSTSGQGAGKVVDAQAADAGHDLLAVIEISSADEGIVHLGQNGPKLEIRDLPYGFSSETN